MEVVQKFVDSDGYIDGVSSYQRTMELRNSVTVGNVSVGYKYVKFEIFMDTDKINGYITGGDEWNQHASVEGMDVSDYIPLWVEEGTSGGLFDRPAAHYMEKSWFELGNGKIASELRNALRGEGWKVIY